MKKKTFFIINIHVTKYSGYLSIKVEKNNSSIVFKGIFVAAIYLILFLFFSKFIRQPEDSWKVIGVSLLPLVGCCIYILIFI